MEQRDARTYAIIGAAMEVYNNLGRGFLEAVYQEAFGIELKARAITFEREFPIPVFYKDLKLTVAYKADFIVLDSIVVELKATQHLTSYDDAQVINYLKATKKEIGLLLNFGSPSLEYRRLALTRTQIVGKSAAP